MDCKSALLPLLVCVQGAWALMYDSQCDVHLVGALLCRTIDRVGGLDAYLLGTPERKLGSDVGMQLRQHIEAALRMRAADQAAAAQLPQAGTSKLSVNTVRRMERRIAHLQTLQCCQTLHNDKGRATSRNRF